MATRGLSDIQIGKGGTEPVEGDPITIRDSTGTISAVTDAGDYYLIDVQFTIEDWGQAHDESGSVLEDLTSQFAPPDNP